MDQCYIALFPETLTTVHLVPSAELKALLPRAGTKVMDIHAPNWTAAVRIAEGTLTRLQEARASSTAALEAKQRAHARHKGDL